MELIAICRFMLGARELIHISVCKEGEKNAITVLKILGAILQDSVARNLCTPGALKKKYAERT